MTTFTATHSADVKSKAVDTLTYNENTRELVIDWHDDLYKYSGVPLETYKAVVAGTYKNGLTDASVGRAAQRVKKDFGPGDYLGKFGEVKFVKADASRPTFPLAAQPATLATKAPTVATSVTAASTYSLTPSPAAPSVNVGSEVTYTVDFKANGERREYTAAGVNSVDEAIAALNEVAQMLGVELTVTGVYVDFDGTDDDE